MKMKPLFLGSATLFMLAAAGLMAQSAISTQANATPSLTTGQTSLMDRVRKLELQQQENHQEFLLIDETLTDMNAKFEIKLMDLRMQLNDLDIPVKPLIGDDIGLPFQSNAASLRHDKGVVLEPGGTGWFQNSGVNPAGYRNRNNRGVVVEPGGTGW